jgi:glycosyltransferase involved in cell wall biosynthesis
MKLKEPAKMRIFWVCIHRFDEKIDKSTWLEIGNNLVKNGFSVVLLTGYGKEKYIPLNNAMNFVYLPSIKHILFFKISLSFSIFMWLLRNVNSDDAIIVESNFLILANFVKKIKKCKIHLDIRTLPVGNYTKARRLERFLFWKFPNKFISIIPDSYSFITQALRKHVENEFKTKFTDYTIWTSGVNFKHFSQVAKYTKDPDDKYLITYLGSVMMSRGLDLIIEALAKIDLKFRDKIFLQIIGDGPHLKILERISKKLGVSDYVKFRGYIPYESVPKHLMTTDCFICPLPNRTEWVLSSPIKVFEYFSCARPIILTPILAHRNIAYGSSDFIIWTKGDKIIDFAESIVYAFENRDYLSKAAKRSISLTDNYYSWEAQGKKFSAYLKRKYIQPYSMSV